MTLRPGPRLLAPLAIALFAAASAVRADPAGPALDRIVSLSGGRQIALHCAGTGSFTVLLEPGDGGRRAHMANLFDALARRYRVCDYDRRNVGRSSSAPVPRQAADLADDLFDTLAAAHVPGPYLLFGTSMGGLLVRSYAATHDVAGFVTSNQPATVGEWKRWVQPLETAAARKADDAWAAGGNDEHIDVNDVSRVIDRSPAPSVPHVILVSTERHQCPAAGTCGPTYAAFVRASQAAADAGTGGHLRVLDGDHDLYVTHLAEVVAAIDTVARAAEGRR